MQLKECRGPWGWQGRGSRGGRSLGPEHAACFALMWLRRSPPLSSSCLRLCLAIPSLSHCHADHLGSDAASPVNPLSIPLSISKAVICGAVAAPSHHSALPLSPHQPSDITPCFAAVQGRITRFQHGTHCQIGAQRLSGELGLCCISGGELFLAQTPPSLQVLRVTSSHCFRSRSPRTEQTSRSIS